MEQGWIKLHRKIKEWEWYKNPDVIRVFLHLVLSANHKPQKWQGVVVGTGQVVIGRKQLSKDLGISEQVSRTCLSRLKSTNEITIQTTNRFSMITICNYKAYNPDIDDINQQVNQAANQQSTNNQPTDNQQLTTNKNDKNVKNDKNKNNGVLISKFLEYWESKKNLPRINAVNKSRQKQFAVRFKEPRFAENWWEIIDKLSKSEFYTGTNGRGWAANIDWILKNDTNYEKILELPKNGNSRTKTTGSQQPAMQQNRAGGDTDRGDDFANQESAIGRTI